MTSKMGYYNVDDYMKQKRQQEKEAKVPPKANFLAAANHVRNVFENRKFGYGFMGGLEMLCLGYRREMPDLQIAYDDRDFLRIKSKLEADQRVRLPDGMNSLFPAKCLVRTGPSYKDEGCTQAADIEVDLVPPGCHGTPPNGGLASNLVLLSLRTEGKLKSYKGLNTAHLVKTLVYYCKVRDLAWDPRKDILFLCQHYGEEVQSIRSQLDHKAVQQNFLGTPYFSRLSEEDQRRCYQTLQGTEPPPIMAVTPPPQISGHKYSASASEVAARSRNTGHYPDLLSPPIPSKPVISQQRASDSKSRPSELPTSSNALSKHPSELAATAKDSRSRYRTISAPNTRETSPTASQTTSPRTIHKRQASHPHMVLAPVSSFVTMQQSLPYQAQAQPHSHLAPFVIGTQGRRSMPNLGAKTTGPITPFSFAQAPMSNGLAQYPQHLPVLVSPVEMSATPVPGNPGQQYLKSQAGLGGLGGYHPLRQHPVNALPITERPIPPQARASQSQRVTKLELSGTHMSVTHTDQLHVVNCGGNPETNLPFAEAQGSLSKLHQSGPAGQFASSQSPTRPMLMQNETADATFSGPVELEASSRLSQFIAELSVERDTPAPEQHQNELPRQYSQSTNRQTHPVSYLQGSPVSPPDLRVAPLELGAQHQDIIIRPLNPRIHSAPLAPLPASLAIGGTAPHQWSPRNNVPYASTIPPTQVDILNTNAFRYARYYPSATPPPSIPNSGTASPHPTPLSAYKAYQPPSLALSPPSLPLSPPAVPQSPPAAHHPTSFTALKDVDGANGYFKSHKRDASNDSSRSLDSSRLAMEYQAELPGYGEGYGSPGRVVD
ncbi:hypothetical protein CC86DRAFT_454083 [Ophiobolus disseminans]|uniref:Uncharacterized protein n=1 Tax=Ophiobolus disseminans TaxID=1469910 RepID=A0A6A7A9R9_9PLEO|nr:hypothetical protein CC86DRAFT_454083 [Ophiobolus disseminans]